jgi:pimeloyl-ACP methyl ester carboxylesterase
MQPASRYGHPMMGQAVEVIKNGVLAMCCVLAIPTLALAQQHVSFATEDGGRICGDLYGHGPRGVVLAHGGRFNKESWSPQAGRLVANGFRVLAIDFRGYGCSIGPGTEPPYDKDVMAAVRYLKTHGTKTVSVVGGSFGAAASGDASIASAPGEIDRIVFLGAQFLFQTDQSARVMREIVRFLTAP